MHRILLATLLLVIGVTTADAQRFTGPRRHLLKTFTVADQATFTFDSPRYPLTFEMTTNGTGTGVLTLECESPAPGTWTDAFNGLFVDEKSQWAGGCDISTETLCTAIAPANVTESGSPPVPILVYRPYTRCPRWRIRASTVLADGAEATAWVVYDAQP